MKWVVLILLCACVVRLGAAWYWHNETIESGRLFRLGDSDSYWVLAGQIAQGKPYQYGSEHARIFRAPLYPICLAPFTLLPDPARGIWYARVMGCLAGTWAVWLCMRLAHRLGGSQAAWCAGWLAACYPGAIGMSIVILSEAVFCPLMLLSLVYWQRTLERDALTGEIAGRNLRQHALLAGICSGLAILARPSWLLFLPFAAVVLGLAVPPRKQQLRTLAWLALGCFLTLVPWWVRNACITARFVPTTLQVGASLYDGLHAGASGGSDENMEFIDRFVEQQRLIDQEVTAARLANQQAQASESRYAGLWRDSTFEYRLNARLQGAAWDWAKKNVSGVLRLALIKLSRTWSLWPAAGEFGTTGLRLVLTLSCFAVLLTALVATCGVRAEWSRAFWLLWLPVIYFTLLHMIFVGSIRYREPAMLVLMALAGFGLSQWLSKQRQAWKFYEPQ